MKILMVLTSHDQLGDTGQKTGFWLEEFASPYYEFIDAGADVTLASPKGGQPPIDPKSHDPDDETDSIVRFNNDKQAQEALANTVQLANIRAEDYDAVFYPGGHGPLWDLAEDADSIKLIENLYDSGKPVAAVCHGPGVFRHTRRDGQYSLVKDKRVTGFTNTEEEGVKLSNIVPFLVEDMLKDKGGEYSKGEDWGSYVVVDGHLVTGQNPASSDGTAKALLEVLGKRQ